MSREGGWRREKSVSARRRERGEGEVKNSWPGQGRAAQTDGRGEGEEGSGQWTGERATSEGEGKGRGLDGGWLRPGGSWCSANACRGRGAASPCVPSRAPRLVHPPVHAGRGLLGQTVLQLSRGQTRRQRGLAAILGRCRCRCRPSCERYAQTPPSATACRHANPAAAFRLHPLAAPRRITRPAVRRSCISAMRYAACTPLRIARETRQATDVNGLYCRRPPPLAVKPQRRQGGDGDTTTPITPPRVGGITLSHTLPRLPACFRCARETSARARRRGERGLRSRHRHRRPRRVQLPLAAAMQIAPSHNEHQSRLDQRLARHTALRGCRAVNLQGRSGR